MRPPEPKGQLNHMQKRGTEMLFHKLEVVG